jgi:hypothetical protein
MDCNDWCLNRERDSFLCLFVQFSSTLRVENIHRSITESRLYNWFEQYGEISSLHACNRHSSTASSRDLPWSVLLTFKEMACAKEAAERAQGQRVSSFKNTQTNKQQTTWPLAIDFEPLEAPIPLQPISEVCSGASKKPPPPPPGVLVFGVVKTIDQCSYITHLFLFCLVGWSIGHCRCCCCC